MQTNLAYNLAHNESRNKKISESINIHESTNKNTNSETDEIYAALKLVQNLYRNNMLEPHVYTNILEEYKSTIDLFDFHDIIH